DTRLGEEATGIAVVLDQPQPGLGGRAERIDLRQRLGDGETRHERHGGGAPENATTIDKNGHRKFLLLMFLAVGSRIRRARSAFQHLANGADDESVVVLVRKTGNSDGTD